MSYLALNDDQKDKTDDDNKIDYLSYSYSVNKDEDYKTLSSVFTASYYSRFMNNKEQSVLNMNAYKDDPLSYLEAIKNKYDIIHPKYDFTDNSNNINYNDDNYKLRPWIQGKIERLMNEKSFFGGLKWETQIFRLFDEALLWFDDDDSMDTKPFGILPLAIITEIKTCDLSKMDGNISEDELLKLELKINNDSVLTLKCADHNQRIKWYECLHTAIFVVQRPLFTKQNNLNVIYNVNDIDQNNYIYMGQSLILNLDNNKHKKGKKNKKLPKDNNAVCFLPSWLGGGACM